MCSVRRRAQYCFMLVQMLSSRMNTDGLRLHYHYFLYYAAQTYFHASGPNNPKPWQQWNAENIKRLEETQQEDGRWDGNFGGSFATAASLLSLALNYRYLPIYER